jgi:hypothetical protein
MKRVAMHKVRQVRDEHNQLLRRSARSSSVGHPLLELQRSVGNQAVQRLIRSPFIQARLQVSTPEDQSEQQADRVADSVMRMSQTDEDLIVAPKSKSRVPVAVREDGEEEGQSVQRVCNECEEETVHRANVEDEEEAVQRDTKTGAKGHNSEINHSATSNIGALNDRGSPLSEATRSFFEPRFGVDFSQVRVHTDSNAAETAESINAKAFTVGRHIAFSSGQYAPQSQEGQHLLAHELTHVVQQSFSGLPLRSAVPTNLAALQPDLVQRDQGGSKGAEAKRAKIDAAIQNLKTKYGISKVSEENGEMWTEAQLKTVDKAFSKMSTEEQAKLKGLELIRTDKLSVERNGKKIEVVGMAGTTWIRFTKKAFRTNMVTLHEVGHVIQKKVVLEVEEKLRKSKVFTDMEAARKTFNEAVSKNKRISGNAEQIDFANAMTRLTSAADDFMNTEETDRQTKESALFAAQADADTARMLIDPKDPVSKTLLDMHDRQRLLIAAITQWVDERAKALGPRKKLTEFVAIVSKHKLAKKSFAPFTDYVAKFWPDEPGEFFAESYATWRNNPDYMRKNAKPLFDWFEKKGHLAP